MEKTQSKQYRNNKNGNLYQVIGRGIDRTNSRDGTPVIIYSPLSNPAEISVREESEFTLKFTAAD